MFIKLLLLFFFSLKIYATTLNATYYIDSRNIKLQNILPDAPYNVTLFKIDQTRHKKRIQSKKILKLLKQHGFKDVTASSNYIYFIKKSPIDTSKINTSIIEYYQEKHPSIKIKSVIVTPRGYVKQLPKQFEVKMQKKSHLSNSGTLSIKTLEKKKLFFDYTLDAKVYVYTAKKGMKKGERISLLNTTKKQVQLDKFKAMPINIEHLNITQSKKNMKADYIINIRDIETLNLVKRGAHVSATFKDSNINISFSAESLQNGKLNDIITIQKRNKKRLRAKVIGKNRVEIK